MSKEEGMLKTVIAVVVLPVIGAALAASVAIVFPQVIETIFYRVFGETFGPFVVLGANDESSSKEAIRGRSRT
jgi:hypothetical protein